MTTKPNGPQPGDLFYQYWHGWRDGAGSRPVDEKRNNHKNEAMAFAYVEGWNAGRAALKKMGQEAAQRYGYTQSILRAQETNKY